MSVNARVPDPCDAGLRLLDRQIVDCESTPIAKVDDVELEYDPRGRPYVVALLCGPGAAGPRIAGRLGDFVVAVWRRIHPAAHPQPARVPMNVVDVIDSAVKLTIDRRVAAPGDGQRWADEHIISRLPGAGHDPF